LVFYTYQGNLQTSQDVYKFFVARLARLYPVYLLALAIGVPLHRRLFRGFEFLVFPLLQSWVPPVSGIGYAWVIQAWTLSVEAFFYLCFPLFLFVFRRRIWSVSTLWLFAAILFAVNVVMRTPMFHPAVPATWLTSYVILPVLCLPEFLFGMSLGALFLRKRTNGPQAVTNDWITFAGMVPCIALISSGVGTYLTSLAAIFCFGWAIYRLADGRGWMTTFLSTRVMLLLGGASYSVYILQEFVREYASMFLARFHPGLDAALSPFLLVGLSCLIFLFYEEPMRNVVRKFLVRRPAPDRAAA
jgi:peptidoglycan/LPS O-acetylase OafA/YrhL